MKTNKQIAGSVRLADGEAMAIENAAYSLTCYVDNASLCKLQDAVTCAIETGGSVKDAILQFVNSLNDIEQEYMGMDILNVLDKLLQGSEY